MKKIGKLFFVLMVGLLIVTGCKDKKDNTKETKDTVATRLVSVFEKEIKTEKDIEKVAKTISTNKNIMIPVEVFEAKEGFLDGFDEEIKGFSNGYAIKPVIGAQPFVAYVFESNEPQKLYEALGEHANRRWNVCTEADELEITTVDNYVFVVMSPTSFEE